MTYYQLKEWGKAHKHEGGALFDSWTKDYYYQYVRQYGAMTIQKAKVLAYGYHIQTTGGI